MIALGTQRNTQIKFLIKKSILSHLAGLNTASKGYFYFKHVL